jgi:hypothetical protein
MKKLDMIVLFTVLFIIFITFNTNKENFKDINNAEILGVSGGVVVFIFVLIIGLIFYIKSSLLKVRQVAHI